MEQIHIDSATESQLRRFGQGALGLPLPSGLNLEALRGKIRAVHPGDFISDLPVAGPAFDVPAAPVPPPSVATPPPASGDPPAASGADPTPPLATVGEDEEDDDEDQKFVTVIITKGQTKEDQQPVPVSVNGRSMWIERGKPSRVRMPYLRVLESAVQKVYHYDEDNNLVTEEVPAYPFQIVPDVEAA